MLRLAAAVLSLLLILLLSYGTVSISQVATSADLAGLREIRSVRYADYINWNYGQGNEKQISEDISLLTQKLECLNRLLIPVNIYQSSLNSNNPHIDSRTISKEVLAVIFKVAKKFNLKIDILPTLLIDPEEEGGFTPWSGEIEPSDVILWFSNYKSVIRDLAKFSQDSDVVDVFLVGAELISMERKEYKGFWQDIIDSVRQVFKGKVSYQTNWWWNRDDFERARDNFPWHSVDYIGLNSYFELTNDPEALTHELINGWYNDRHNQNVVNDVTSIYAKYHIPIVFWETGYQSKDQTTIFPWDFFLNTPEDQEEQLRGYEALRLVWNTQDFIYGYSLFVVQYNNVLLEQTFTQYSPINKKAENEAQLLLCR